MQQSLKGLDLDDHDLYAERLQAHLLFKKTEGK